MVFKVGLYPRFYATYKYSVVQVGIILTDKRERQLRLITWWGYVSIKRLLFLIFTWYFPQYHELLGDCTLLIWNGGNDYAENFTQRHRQIQSNGQFSKCGLIFTSFLEWKYPSRFVIYPLRRSRCTKKLTENSFKFSGGCSRGVRLEISAWGRFPPSTQGDDIVSVSWKWCPNFLHDLDYFV